MVLRMPVLRRDGLFSRGVVLVALSILPRNSVCTFFTAAFSSEDMSFITERDGKGTITISPKNEALQSGLVVLSHGLGDSAEGMVDIAEVRKTCILHVCLCVVAVVRAL